MRSGTCLIIISLLVACTARAQTIEDTLPEVTVGVYLDSQRSLLKLPASVSAIDSSAMALQHGQSLVPVLNAAPGVRMEERSPGSYRLSIRGSLIRSPFGVRNIKTYLDGLPLTNGGGETYLNIIDLNAIRSLEISKGPDGSLFGANSGGVLQLNTRAKYDTTEYLKISLAGGSFGLLQENVQLRVKAGRSFFGFDQGYMLSDGYREHSSLNRKYYQITNSLQYTPSANLKALFFYADHAYKTPGGLTLKQMAENPKQARPSTAFTRSAQEQNSSVNNLTFFGGITNEIRFRNGLKNVLSVFGSQTHFENPFITNYEIRDESNIGARTWIEFEAEGANWLATVNIGGEYQEMIATIENYDNQFGALGSLRAADQAIVRTGFVFARVNWSYANRLQLEASLSDNFNSAYIKQERPIGLEPQITDLVPQVTPRLAASYFLVRGLALRAIVSRGYSPPTLQEIRSPSNSVNTALQPEHGWNYEAGWRYNTRNNRLWWDASAFYFKLQQAIVRKVDQSGNEFFVNAGGTDQRGIESAIRFDLVKKRSSGFCRQFSLNNSTTISSFEFSQGDYAGNSLTGVPEYVFITSATARFAAGVYLFFQHNHTARLPLNDQNSEWAADFDVFSGKVGWTKSFKVLTIDLNAGVGNLGNELYSLGNDLNAVGGRYYNPAPVRNYFVRLSLTY